MSFAHVDLEDLDLLVSSIPSDYYTVSASYSVGFSDLRREGFDRDIPFMAERSKVCHSLLSIWLWVSIFFSASATGGCFSDDG